ncbi:MAG: DUF308 domain-containing protein [Methanoregula sp.]|nr:DUF308 domain-containing protein [Methanoregula sp.]
MTKLDDFLNPLYHGVWEVVVEKSSVTEPLDAGWMKSTLNVPSPGTIASFRKGQYHVHETRTEWRVHLDRHDPKKHPLLHLADDAPLLLMIGETCSTLITHIRHASGTDTQQVMDEQRLSWQRQILLGISVLFAGILIVANPIGFIDGVTHLVIPPLLMGFGILIAWKGFDTRSGGKIDWEGVLQGVAIFCTGIITRYFPLLVWSLAILAVLAVWALATAVILLFQIVRQRTAIPEGLWNRLITGILSLLLVIAIISIPRASVMIIVAVLGVIAILGGIMFIVNGMRLRQWMVAPVAA